MTHQHKQRRIRINATDRFGLYKDDMEMDVFFEESGRFGVLFGGVDA